MEISNFLRTVPLFTKLEDAELQRFAELTREKSYPKGSVILFEDDPGDSLFIVRDGRIQVSREPLPEMPAELKALFQERK